MGTNKEKGAPHEAPRQLYLYNFLKLCPSQHSLPEDYATIK